jgi:hypothetical protein
MISVSRAPTVAHADLLLEGSCNFRPCSLVPVTIAIGRASARRDSRYTHL